MPLTTVEPTRLYRQIADQIATLIDRGEFAAGARLPAERELASLLGVSRTSVREAIICARARRPRRSARRHRDLRLRGPDAGARIGGAVGRRRAGPVRPARRPPGDRRRDRRARRAHDHAVATSPRCARRCAACASDADDSPARMPPTASSTCAIAAGDRQRRAARRRERPVGRALRQPLWTRIEAHFHTPALRARTLEDHAAIVAALEAHDPDAARAAMHRHLARVDSRIPAPMGRDGPGATVPARAASRDAQQPRTRHPAYPPRRNHIMKFELTRVAAALAAAAICLPATAKEFRSADVHPEDYPTVMAVKFMSDYIKQKTSGKRHDQGLYRQPARRREGHDRADARSARSTSSASTSRR